ncbi:MAG: hypothetical protein A2Y25_09660 [Candidatus Melainabacteria bacterium GWF2_37_15]|nr:MAG: hypothetical protein A2Y25_09660 [Candidatus Melainabacteria bacterium GWF2_37_15]
MPKILNLKQVWRDCIESCSDCHNVCVETAAYSLQQGGELSDAKHIAILYDCIDICQASINSMSRGSELANKICATCGNICEICANHCDMFDDSKVKDCARVCRECAAQCREMAAVSV